MNENFAKIINTLLAFILFFSVLYTVFNFIENIVEAAFVENQIIELLSFSSVLAFIFAAVIIYFFRHKLYSKKYLEIFYPNKKKFLSLIAFSIMYYLIILLGEIINFLSSFVNFIEFVISLGSYNVLLPILTIYVIVCFMNNKD